MEVTIRRWAILVGIFAGAAFLALSFRGAVSRWYTDYVYRRHLGVTRVVALASAMPHRAVKAQLSGGFAYRPYGRTTRGGPVALQVSVPLLAEVAQIAQRGPSHALGLARLALGDARNALADLEASREREGDDPHVLADLAAAYYEEGMRSGDAETLMSALDVASLARKLDPGLAAALFNRALAVEALHFAPQAIVAWNEYLDIKPDASWAAEARDHIAALTARMEKQPRSEPTVEQIATRIESDLLPAWADSILGSDVRGAEVQLREATEAASHLLSCCGDEFHRRSIEALRGSAPSALALAHQQYRDGRKKFAANETTAAIPLLESSRDRFRDANDVFAAKPWKYVAASYLYVGDTRRAVSEADGAIAFCTAYDCGAVQLAHLRWVRGLALGRAGDPQRSLDDYGQALKGFESGKEFENAASIHALIAENLHFLGTDEDAWSHRLIAMREAERSGTLDRIYLACTGASEAAMAAGHLVSARLFQDVIVETARREKNTVLLADALVKRSRVRQRANERGATTDLDEAAALTANVPDLQRRARLAAAVARGRSEIDEPFRAIDDLSIAIRFNVGNENHYRLAELYQARAVAEEKIAMRDASAADYRRCIQELEAERATLSNPSLRERYFTRGSSSVFDMAIRHLWVSARREDAFRLAEQSRARELAGSEGPPAVTTETVRASLRPGDVLIEYMLLPDRTIVWILKPEGAVTREWPVTGDAVDGAVARLQKSYANDERLDAALGQIAALVYEPLADAVRDARRLIVVGNKSMRGIPFSALRDRTRGRYLIEDHEIVVAPAAAAYVRSLNRDRQLDRNRLPNVFVASYTDGDEARKLPPLPHGQEEVELVRSVYAGVESIDGPRATPFRVLSAASDAMVVHIVAHGVEVEERPEYSSIVLAPAAEGRDLYAKMIAAASFRRTRLVVLSSCGRSHASKQNDAPLTLSESFLAAGVPVVVGALTAVDDEAAAAFAGALHRAFAASGDPIDALRRAQIACLSSKAWRSPRFWAPWIAVGGAA
jgi:tetratricopeptide (TPR) repeat protein